MVTENQIQNIISTEVQAIIQDADLSRLLLTVYIYLFDCKNPKFCTKSLTEYHEAIKQNGLNIYKLKTMERKYVLKKDLLIWDALTSKHYNADTITDAIAHRMVTLNPRMAHNFESIKTPEIIKPELEKIAATKIEIEEPVKEKKPRQPKQPKK